MIAMPPAVEERLQHEANIWLASVRPDGRPHLVPLWFVLSEGRIYLCVQERSVKVRNILANPRVALALESGNKPVVLEGAALLLPRPWPPAVHGVFQHKYQWDIYSDGEYDSLIEVIPQRWLLVGNEELRMKN